MKEIRILIVDDLPEHIKVFTDLLLGEDPGFKIYAASNGKNAVELAKIKIPHLIVIIIRCVPHVFGTTQHPLSRLQNSVRGPVVSLPRSIIGLNSRPSGSLAEYMVVLVNCFTQSSRVQD